MEYIRVEFTCKAVPKWQIDLLINDLSTIGFDVFEDLYHGFNAFIPKTNFNPISIDSLLSQLPGDLNISYSTEIIPSQNWNETWESNFKPLTIVNQCYIRASFHKSKADQFPYEIVIDPKMAFGTGHHQTTSLMIEFLLEESMSGRAVLDIGCGTGILGILASKLGSKSVVAIDNDPICYESTKENKVLNSIKNLDVLLGDSTTIPSERYSLIIANINRNVLLDQILHYSNHLDKNGVLLMSGFYQGDDLEIIKLKANEVGFEYKSCKLRDNWVAAKFIKI